MISVDFKERKRQNLVRKKFDRAYKHLKNNRKQLKNKRGY
ncbi:hypothetical protein NC99_16080 [Sunxiuqinia dokdonensis]|uniref:Uncharacterized protein n=1 Tax=Sunxiuqinia dokdonensis TaxID=1409788 RepID=A0A0L8VAT9_9BACT|nr:hypothetical protein NC99_16080 [Sunxiuqinia dokdonensis]